MKRLLIVIGLIVLATVFVPAGVHAMEVDLPYRQTFQNSSGADVENTFDYQITPMDAASPMPEGTKDGVYRFSLKGNTSGNLNLDISFTRPGYYHYQVQGDAPNQKEDYTYDKHIYQVMVMVLNENNGLEIGAMTIQDPDLAKYEALKFRTGYKMDGKEDPDDDEGDPVETPGETPGGGNPEEGAPGDGNPGGGGTGAASTVPGGNTPTAPPTTPPSGDPSDTTIQDGSTPLVNIDGDFWSLADLILTILTAILSILAILLIIRRRKQAKDAREEAEELEEKRAQGLLNPEDEEEAEPFETKKQLRWKGIVRTLQIIPPIGAAILFIKMQDLTQPMGWIDEWTIWHLIIFIINAVMAVISRKVIDEDQDNEVNKSE